MDLENNHLRVAVPRIMIRVRGLGSAIKLCRNLCLLYQHTSQTIPLLQLYSCGKPQLVSQVHSQPQTCIPKSFSANSFFPLWDGGYVPPIPFAKASCLTHIQSHSLESDPPALSLNQNFGSKSDPWIFYIGSIFIILFFISSHPWSFWFRAWEVGTMLVIWILYFCVLVRELAQVWTR